jgi:hypothetical protein
MDLKEFVSVTLTQIAEGVAAAFPGGKCTRRVGEPLL